MSRSNYDKPFYVDVGTSVVAIRCASNHDVVERYDYAWSPDKLKLAEDICDRMNKEAEIGKPLRNCDAGTVKEQINRFREFCEKEICRRYRCGHGCKATCIDRCAIAWAQTPYEAEEGSTK